MRSGDLLLKCTSQADCEKILSTHDMLGTKIAASYHKTLNTSRGVIAVPELIDVPEEEILTNLKEQGVTNVRKLKIRKNNEYIITRNVVLTFDKPTIPQTLKVGYLSAEVRPYIPNPLRCFRCNRFGHGADACRGSPCCTRCGQTTHETKECKETEQCVNCSGEHPAYSRSCAKWKMEKEILHIKVTQNISYPEAKKKVSPFLFQKSFAAIVKEKPTMITRCTQTDPNRNQTQGDLPQLGKPVTPSLTPPQRVVSPPSSSMEVNSMDCDDDSSSERSFVSTGSTTRKHLEGGLSRSGSLPDISDKELADARKKPARKRITGPKKNT
ncbi:uncharacterized protein LOC135389389 [Ornithodoros turicata]|uniref:uncharacterized protein LOC135389389 n=1 Tax=Ornithodoros turicata TaxID=34597 RepID=UPI00313A16F4